MAAHAEPWLEDGATSPDVLDEEAASPAEGDHRASSRVGRDYTDALRRELPRYMGKPCPRGHDGLRYTSSDDCVECSRVRSQERRAEKREPWPMSPSWRADRERTLLRAERLVRDAQQRLDALVVPAKADALAALEEFEKVFATTGKALTSTTAHHVYDYKTASVRRVEPASAEERAEYVRLRHALHVAINEPMATRRHLGRALRARASLANELARDDALIAAERRKSKPRLIYRDGQWLAPSVTPPTPPPQEVAHDDRGRNDRPRDPPAPAPRRSPRRPAASRVDRPARRPAVDRTGRVDGGALAALRAALHAV